MEFINGDEGYAVGLGGTILHTVDGGNIWIIQESNTTNDLYDICLAPDGGLWIIGEWGIILKHKSAQQPS